MITIAELAAVLSLTKERTKQLIMQLKEDNPSIDIETGSVWKIGPHACKTVIESRGFHYPKRKVVTFAALKGGIGKTTLSINVAVRAASFGAKTLLIDIVPEACATSALSSTEYQIGKGTILFDVLRGATTLDKAIIKSKYQNLDILPSSLSNHKSEKEAISANPKKLIKDKLDFLKEEYNLIFLELPPSFTTLTSAAYLAADLIIIPCTPNIFALESVALTIEAIDKASDEFEAEERNYKILMNQFNDNRVASQSVWAALTETYGSKVLPTQIKDSAEIENSTNAGLTIFEAKCSKSVKERFNELTLSVCGLTNDEK